jgi:hypothetical protein
MNTISPWGDPEGNRPSAPAGVLHGFRYAIAYEFLRIFAAVWIWFELSLILNQQWIALLEIHISSMAAFYLMILYASRESKVA